MARLDLSPSDVLCRMVWVVDCSSLHQSAPITRPFLGDELSPKPFSRGCPIEEVSHPDLVAGSQERGFRRSAQVELGFGLETSRQ